MSGEVVIGSLELALHGLPEVGPAEPFVRQLLEMLEQELDRREVDRTSELNLRRLDLSISLSMERLDLGLIAAQIARALAGRIAEAAQWARQGVPLARPFERTATVFEAEVLVEAATLVGQGRTEESHQRLVQLGRVAPERRLGVQSGERPTSVAAILAQLGGWVRAGQEEVRIAALPIHQVRDWLELLERHFATSQVMGGAAGAATSWRWERAWVRSAPSSAEGDSKDEPRRLLRVIGGLVRLGRRVLLEDSALSAQLGAALHRVLNERRPEGASEPSTGASSWNPVHPDSAGPPPSAPAGDVRSRGAVPPPPARAAGGLGLEAEAGGVGVVAEEPLFIDTELGGLVFALVPLLSADFDERRHPDGPLLIYEILRGLVEAEVGTALLGDPAPHLLSGLSAEPTPEERHPEHPHLAAPWIQQVREDLRAWLSWPVDRGLQPILQIPARLWLRPDRIVVQLPFTEHYTTLLKAGLLVDWRFLRWLDHRDLLLSFGQRPWEES